MVFHADARRLLRKIVSKPFDLYRNPKTGEFKHSPLYSAIMAAGSPVMMNNLLDNCHDQSSRMVIDIYHPREHLVGIIQVLHALSIELTVEKPHEAEFLSELVEILKKRISVCDAGGIDPSRSPA